MIFLCFLCANSNINWNVQLRTYVNHVNIWIHIMIHVCKSRNEYIFICDVCMYVYAPMYVYHICIFSPNYIQIHFQWPRATIRLSIPPYLFIHIYPSVCLSVCLFMTIMVRFLRLQLYLGFRSKHLNTYTRKEAEYGEVIMVQDWYAYS